MNRKKKAALLLAGVLLLLSACSAPEPAAGNSATPAATEAASASSVAGTPATDSLGYSGISFENKLEMEYMGWSNNKLDGTDVVFQKLEELFNMELTYSSVPNNEYQNYSSMRIASGDLPEMFKTMVPNDAGMGVYKGLQMDGVIINISDYTAQYDFPNLEKIYEDPTVQLMKEEDGYYMVPNYLGPGTAALYIRQDWVDTLGLEMPKTTDEFREFLSAIVTADPDGAKTTGLTVVGPDAVGMGGLESVITMFTGTCGNWVNVDGQWVYKAMQPGFKEGVRYAADLYANNLLDPEFAMMNNTTIQEKIASGKAAALFLNGTAAWFNPMQTAMTAYKPDATLNCIVPWPAGPAGDLKPGGTSFFGAVHISAECTEEQRLRALAFLDWQFTPECLDLYYYGIEGEQHTVVNGEKVINEEAKQAITFGRDLYLFYDVVNNVSQYDYQVIEPLNRNLEWSRKVAVPEQVVGLSTELTMELAPRFNDIYVRWVVDFVTGTKNIDAEWDAFLAEIEAAGYADYQQEVTSYMADK